MRPEFASQLRCPACHLDRGLQLTAESSNDQEVREGQLRCRSCGATFPVARGVAHLLHDPPEHVIREAAGLERFAERMRQDDWNREMIRRLPDVDNGYWYVQARSMHQLLTTVPFQAGQSILDVGSNTCWAANHFAERGLRAVALDIATTELQGLHTADYFIDDGKVFFERVLGTMNDIPIASSSLDYVYCCEVLHHNDRLGLERTLREAYRVLRPGGKLLVVNETLKVLGNRTGVDVDHFDVGEFEGYEHAHWAPQYRRAATRAGFRTELLEPHYVPFFGDTHLELAPETPALEAIRSVLGYTLRPNKTARRLHLLWLYLVSGKASLSMIATKPQGIARPRWYRAARWVYRSVRPLPADRS